MTYRAAWYMPDGVTISSGLDLGDIKPGATGSVTRLFRNIGDQPLSTVQFTLKDNADMSVNGTPLVVGETYESPPLAPGESLTVTASKTNPVDAAPGIGSAFVLIRALT